MRVGGGGRTRLFRPSAHANEGVMLDLFVDADACPVRSEIFKVADRYALKVFVVTCGNVRVPFSDRVRLVLVEAGPDAADDWIADQIGANDICITNDVLLAARCLRQGASAVRPTGRLFTVENVGDAVAQRDLAAHLREIGTISGGPPPFASSDRSRFAQALDTLVNQLRRKAV